MLSIHSPDYVFTVLVSIFMKTHNHFRVPSQCYKCVSDGVLCFHYSRMRIANDTYHVRTNVPMPPALCLGTPVPRQKVCWRTSCLPGPAVSQDQLFLRTSCPPGHEVLGPDVPPGYVVLGPAVPCQYRMSPHLVERWIVRH